MDFIQSLQQKKQSVSPCKIYWPQWSMYRTVYDKFGKVRVLHPFNILFSGIFIPEVRGSRSGSILVEVWIIFRSYHF